MSQVMYGIVGRLQRNEEGGWVNVDGWVKLLDISSNVVSRVRARIILIS